jgi:hypothetical protein
VELFKVYQWILCKDVSTLQLTSALSMNASSEKVLNVIDKKLKALKDVYIPPETILVDRNLAIINNPVQYPVGTSFEQHPSYPKLGNRVVHVSNLSILVVTFRSQHTLRENWNCYRSPQKQHRSLF